MRLHPEDPRLTSYALGELDLAEAKEVESAIHEDPGPAEEYRNIRGIQNFLLSRLPTPDKKLTELQRETILAGAHKAAQRRRLSGLARLTRSMQPLLIPAAAAIVLGVATLLLMQMPGDEPPISTVGKTADTVKSTTPADSIPKTNDAAPMVHASPQSGKSTRPAELASLVLPIFIPRENLDTIKNSVYQDGKLPPKNLVIL